MWISFLVAGIICTAFLVIPGFFFFKGLGFESSDSIAYSPIYTCALYPSLGIAFNIIDISLTWSRAISIAVIISILVCAARKLIHSHHRFSLSLPQSSSASHRLRSSYEKWFYLALYVACGLIVTLLVFVISLDGPASFVQGYDNGHHLTMIRSFVDSGNWSSLSYTMYGSDNVDFVPPAQSSFYPAGLHCLAAMVMESCGSSATLALNATNAAFSGVVYPLGSYAIMKTLFSDRKRVVAIGALMCLSFVAFPWKLLEWGPVFPNFAAFCLVPAECALFISAIRDKKESLLSIIVAMLFGIVAIVLLHPNAFFSTVLILLPFCISSIRRFFSTGNKTKIFHSAKHAGLIASVLFVMLFSASWMIAFNLPMMQSAVSVTWVSFASPSQSLLDILTMSFQDVNAQILLGICVIAGCAFSLKRKRERWLIASLLIVSFIYVICASSEGPIKQLLAGFWYTDAHRLAANVVLAAVPLASLGVDALLLAIVPMISRWMNGKSPSTMHNRFVALLCLIVLFGAIFYPNYSISGRGSVETAFGDIETCLSDSYNATRDNVLDSQEKIFLQKVAEIVPSNALVINQPYDGSVWAYALYGINVYYRNYLEYGSAFESEESKSIRTRLAYFSHDTQVQRFLKESDAQYLLLLDQGDYMRKESYFFPYEEQQWKGINRVTNSSPGFQEVLRSGDCVLYKILD